MSTILPRRHQSTSSGSDQDRKVLRALAQAQATAEAASQRAEHLERLVAQLTGDVIDGFITLDANGRITGWQGKLGQVFGWNGSDVVGQELSLVPTDSEAIATGDITKLAAEGGQSQARRVEMPVIRPDGSAVPVEFTICPAESDGGGYNVYVRKMYMRALPNQIFCPIGSIVESSDAAITSQGTDGRILTWNKAAENVYGYSAQEVIGRPASLLVPADLESELKWQHDFAAKGQQVSSHETVRLRKDGTAVDVAVTISPVYDPQGNVAGVSTIARDITEQRKMARDLEKALEQAHESESRTRRFLADAAHQLRNPIAGIRACADTFLRTDSAQDRERLLELLLAESFRATGLINALLRIARLDRGETLELRPCDLGAIAEQEAERVRLQSPDLDVIVTIGPELDSQPRLDADTVREVLANLLDNARRYATRRIHVSAVGAAPHRDGPIIELRVSDDGPGLAAHMADAAFERFTTLDPKGGSGLGLPIARGLARAHGGDLSYEDGAFVLRIPDAPVVDSTVLRD